MKSEEEDPERRAKVNENSAAKNGSATKHSSAIKYGADKAKRHWIVKIVFISFFLSVIFSFASTQILSSAGYLLAFVVLAIFILLGIVFDIIGVAVTAANEKPFHSMASHRERGAAQAIKLIKNAEKVGNFCNDVVGDISAIVSGATTTVIISHISSDFSVNNVLLQLLISGLVASITIGGKALGKNIAIKKSNEVVLSVGKLISIIKPR